MAASAPPIPSTPRRAADALGLEQATFAHAVVFVLAASWGFGGNIYWMRTPLAAWGTLALVLTAAGLWRRQQRAGGQRYLLWPLPLVLFSAFVLVSCLNPNARVQPFFDSLVYRPITPPYRWLPSTAVPSRTAHELWLYAGLFLTGVNLALNVRRRRTLHRLLVVLFANGVALAVFGTLQKLTGAPGLFFGLQRSPNPTFFASFVYHNHWGPFALFNLTAGLLLLHRVARDRRKRDFWHSPGPLLLCGLVLIAAAIPLSTSRSSTLMLVVLVLAATGYTVRRLWRAARQGAVSRRAPLVFLAFLAAASGSIAWLGWPIIRLRVEKTREQLAYRQEVGGLGGREILYGDTWRMFRDRPWAGWGFESYETVFVRYNTQGSPRDRLQLRFDQAHSDWLQALAETGVIGTTLLLLMGGIPLFQARQSLLRGHVVPTTALFTCTLVALYAWVEFPFANPAVALTFWIMFFTGIRYATLSDD